MFEKEAEEYANRFWGKKESLDRACTIDNFKDGAEFGYNKAKEEYATELKEVVETCNHWQEVAEKANEWHKESPKVSMPLILIRYRCHVDNEIYVALGKYDADYGGNKFQSDYWNVFDDEVIAWKEIVLPEE